MSHVTKGISVKKMPVPRKSVMPGTVSATQVVNTDILQNPFKNTTPAIDGVSTILNNLSSLQESHLAGSEIYFKQNLPFYTCINALENVWQKEMPDGSVYQVILTFDWENDKPVEKLIKKIK
jgi:hypothetical protein